MASLNPNKHLKEQFVSNLTGSSKLEIASLLTTLSFMVLIRHCIGFNYPNPSSIKKDDDAAASNKSFIAYSTVLIVDFLVIIVPSLLFMTVLADWTYENTVVVSLVVLLMTMFKRRESSVLPKGSVDSVRESISSFRVSTTLLACACILAVDFKIFPRRYAKTETYGTSLMDLGVGSFVVTNSLVSRQARGISNVKLGDALRTTSPLIFLGFARLITTSTVNYQVHVGEYGVHWNFFFTLAGVAILSAVVKVSRNYCGLLGSIVLVGYQALLSSGFNEYLLSEDRGADIFSQNKEGIFSMFGYWGMYLVGVQIGSYLFIEEKGVSKLGARRLARTRAWVLCLLFWSISLLLDWKIERASRRMCNMTYVFLVWAMNLQILAIMLSDFVTGCHISVLEKAFDQNLLASFLLANVFTGLVNLSVDTLSVSPISAVAILLAYLFGLSFVVGSANFLGVRLKFW